MSQVISLTNKRGIAMVVPAKEGNHVELASGETKLVAGEYEYYHHIARSMNGLVVKVAEGEKTRLLEAAQKQDIVRATVTNHRKVKILLDTGIQHKAISIMPGETSAPTLMRSSIVKKMHGIAVKVIDEVKSEAPKSEEPKKTEEPKKPAEPATDTAASTEAVQQDEALAKKRAACSLPATLAEWNVFKEQMTWPDVRGACKELDIKTKSSSKEELLEEITKTLYPS